MKFLGTRNVDLQKTITYLAIHLTIGFTVAYLFTGSIALAGGIALVEPCVNAIAFYFHEKVWKRVAAKQNRPKDLAVPLSLKLSTSLGNRFSAPAN